jgi:hypothetical protein
MEQKNIVIGLKDDNSKLNLALKEAQFKSQMPVQLPQPVVVDDSKTEVTFLQQEISRLK